MTGFLLTSGPGRRTMAGSDQAPAFDVMTSADAGATSANAASASRTGSTHRTGPNRAACGSAGGNVSLARLALPEQGGLVLQGDGQAVTAANSSLACLLNTPAATKRGREFTFCSYDVTPVASRKVGPGTSDLARSRGAETPIRVRRLAPIRAIAGCTLRQAFQVRDGSGAHHVRATPTRPPCSDTGAAGDVWFGRTPGRGPFAEPGYTQCVPVVVGGPVPTVVGSNLSRNSPAGF